MTAKPIDYSKWDRLEEDEDSDHHDNSEGEQHPSECGGRTEPCAGSTSDSRTAPAKPSPPQVTRLDFPSSVTIGPNGVSFTTTPPLATASPFLGASAKPHASLSTTAACDSSVGLSQPAGGGTSLTLRQRSAEADISEDLEDELLLNRLSRNGQRVANRYVWCQTRDSATFSVFLPQSVKGKHVVRFSVAPCPLSENASTFGSAILSFDLEGIPGVDKQTFSFPLRYPVKCREDDVEGCWQLLDLTTQMCRLLVVQLTKDDVAKGVHLWWDRACVDETPIAASSIVDRDPGNDNSAFQKVWHEAHEEFRRRAKARGTSVDLHPSEA